MRRMAQEEAEVEVEVVVEEEEEVARNVLLYFEGLCSLVGLYGQT